MRPFNVLSKSLFITLVVAVVMLVGTTVGLHLYYQETLQELTAVESLTGESRIDEILRIREASQRQSHILALLLTLVASAIVFTFAVILTHRRVQALENLAEDAKRLARGDYDKREPIDEADSQQVHELGDALESIRSKLRRTTITRDYLNRVLSGMNDAVILTSRTGVITRVNDAAENLLGQPERKLLGRSIREFIGHRQRGLFETLDEHQRPREALLQSRGGVEIPISFTSSRIEADDPDLAGYIFAAQNISERKTAEKRIRYLARIDALTKVPNRMQFQHLLQRTIARARRGSDQLALLYLDVDRFKDINDTFGHSAGDTCLETLTSRLKSLLPDGTIIGRLAGDEFGIILDRVGPEEGLPQFLHSIARLVLSELSQPIVVDGNELHMTASIGIACYPEDADNVIDIIRNADSALYHAKRSGGDGYEFFDAKMKAEAVERLMLKSKLRQSYEMDELLLNYQPQIDLRTGRIVGAEALVRWELSEHGLVLPTEFIPLAEETNLILQIGEWVLDHVCADYRRWQTNEIGPGKISVNLSLKQLSQPNFPTKVRQIFGRHGVHPTSVELEITESTLMQDTNHTVGILNDLHNMGLKLAIDDFGTGYSSLSALQQFPISTLKIDKSFVRDITDDADDATIVGAIVDMGHSLNMQVVAEGVEFEEQLDALRAMGCDIVQGLLFGQPMTADEYFELLQTERDGTNTYRTLFG